MYPKVSIVVAAYNVEKYIKRCITSLINQTLKDIEILVINDGSKDDTALIVKEFEQEDSRVKLISQANGGLSAARNTGINHAKAEYIAFLDGDDYVHKTMYEKLYSRIVAESADLAICNFYKVWEDDEFQEKKRSKRKVKSSFLGKNTIENFLTKHDEPFVVAWNKLYKTSIIKDNQLYFENKAFFEDVGFMPRYLFYSQKNIYVNESLYYYIQRAGSITKSYNPIIEESSQNTIKIVKDFFENKLPKGYIEAFELRLLLYMINYFLKNKRNINNLFKRVLELEAHSRLLPFRHRVGIWLIKAGLYEKVYGILGK